MDKTDLALITYYGLCDMKPNQTKPNQNHTFLLLGTLHSI